MLVDFVSTRLISCSSVTHGVFAGLADASSYGASSIVTSKTELTGGKKSLSYLLSVQHNFAFLPKVSYYKLNMYSVSSIDR